MYISRSLQGVGVTLMFLLAALDVNSQEAAQKITLDPGTTIAAGIWIRHRTTPEIQKLE